MDDATLLDAIEIGSLVLPPIPEVAWFLDVPGVLARETTLSHPFVNLVAMARLEDDAADATIERVRAHFASAGKAFGWMVGPRSRPTDLAARLERHGLARFKDIDGLACTDLGLSIPIPSDVEVRTAGPEERDAFDALKAATFDMPLPAARWIDDMLFAAPPERVRLALAYLDGEPVGFAQTFWHGRVAILAGAGVLTAHRGRGVFRALLAQRFADARAHDLSAATIQAYEDTSAPILARLGFRGHGRLALFTGGS